MLNVKMPKLIYGTAWKKERTVELVQQAVTMGFRGIDTACQPKHYREDLVGEALSRLYADGFKREELFIQTKFTPIGGQDPNNIPYNPSSSLQNQVMDSFEVSKKNLKTSYVDSLVLHSPLFPFKDLMSIWQTMESIFDTHEAKQLGISNCYELALLEKLYKSSRVKPSIVQNRFYADTGYDKELREWCDSHDVIYQSFWSLTANPQILHSVPLASLSRKYDRTPEQIFFRYLSHCHIVPLIGSTSDAHIKQDLEIFEFELEPEEVRAIDGLL